VQVEHKLSIVSDKHGSLTDEINSSIKKPDFQLPKNGNKIELRNYKRPNFSIYRLQAWIALVQFEKYRTQMFEKGWENVVGITVENETVIDFEIMVPKTTPVKADADTVAASDCSLMK